MYDDRARRTFPFMASSASGQQLLGGFAPQRWNATLPGSLAEVSYVTQTAELA